MGSGVESCKGGARRSGLTYLAPVEVGGQQRAIDECDGHLGRNAQVEVGDLHLAALQVHVGLLHLSIHRKVAGTRDKRHTHQKRRSKTYPYADDMIVFVENPKEFIMLKTLRINE